MSIKLANNAIAHLSASLASTDVTVVLESAEAGSFPSLSAGEWHPMTIIAPSGAFEIVKVTSRTGNLLTVQRGAESTAAMDFAAGARAEIRMTASVVTDLETQIATSLTAAETLMDGKDAEIVASVNAQFTINNTAQQAVMDTKDAALHATVTTEIATAKAEAIAAANAHSDAALAAITGQLEPIGTIKPWLSASPQSGWAFAYGQVLVRADYPALFAFIGTTFGAGDGSTTFNLPDLRGRALIGRDNMGGVAAGRVTTGGSGLDGSTLGANGGADTHTLTAAQVAPHSHTASTTVNSASAGTPAGTVGAGGTHSHNTTIGTTSGSPATYRQVTTSGAFGGSAITTDTEADHTHAFTGSAMAAHAHTASTTVNNSTGGSAHNNMQPSIVCNYVIRIQ